MAWGDFLTIIAQVFIAALVLFVLTAMVSAVVKAERKER
jgi:large-conductance mechanosensitive channel